jgi:hypothetical protein
MSFTIKLYQPVINSLMKTLSLLILILISLTSFGQNSGGKEVDLQKLPAHPRLLLLKGEEQSIKRAIVENRAWEKMHNAIVAEAEKMINLPMLERIQIGRRLLDKSRECIRRVFYLSYAYRMTGDKKFFDRAEKEMLNVAKFTDWNPNHFLDVAEMTLGMAIGYDWLNDALSDESRKTIANAIVMKGLIPSLDRRYNYWQRYTHNWNQVCNAGLSYGAIAVASRYPGVAKQILDRAVNTIHLPMEDYQPDGAYPEGYIYWDYGTSFNVLFLSAVDKAFGTDFELTSIPGFLKTGGFYMNMTGVTGLPFNWGDCGNRAVFNPAMFWFAQKNNDPSLIWVEKGYLDNWDVSSFTRNRLLPAVMVWGKEIALDKIAPPAAKAWMGQGANPVAMFRTSWTDLNATYLAFKAGSPSVNHGHMDIGSFVFESNGIRWASDFGMQDYESLESKGIRLFGRTQDSERWKVFRYNNFVHNTLTVNRKHQRVNGYAKIDRYSDNPAFSYAVSDLTAVYDGQVAGVKRGVALVEGKYAMIQDEITAKDTATTVRWTMLTQADVTLSKNSATLKKEGKELLLKVKSGSKVTMKTWSTEPTTDYDAPNPGTILVGFEVQLPPGKKETIQVTLLPKGTKASKKSQALESW